MKTRGYSWVHERPESIAFGRGCYGMFGRKSRRRSGRPIACFANDADALADTEPVANRAGDNPCDAATHAERDNASTAADCSYADADSDALADAFTLAADITSRRLRRPFRSPNLQRRRRSGDA